MPKLTRDHFSISEMSECSIAERLGIDNTPNLKIIENLAITVGGLERVRALLGYPVHVNSGYRCFELERLVCEGDFKVWCSRNGEPAGESSWTRYLSDKPHPRGFAADFTCAQFGSPREIISEIQKSKIEFDQCILEGSWVHISFDPRMRREVLEKRF